MSFSLVAKTYPKTRKISAVFTFKKDVISMLKEENNGKKIQFYKGGLTLILKLP